MRCNRVAEIGIAAGKDGRFDEVKTRPLSFLMAWTLQGLWVLLTAAAALAVITGGSREPLGAVGVTGVVIWAIGMLIEIVADQQKSAFKRDPANKGKFIDVGLWSWSRHPNTGEMSVAHCHPPSTGAATTAIPVHSMISPK